MLYSITAQNNQGIDGLVSLSNGKTIQTNHPLNDQPGFNPEELLALAWSTCLNATIQALLENQPQKRRSTVDVTVSLMKEETEPGYYFQVDATVRIENLNLEEAKILVKQAHNRCPVSKLIKDARAVTVETLIWS